MEYGKIFIEFLIFTDIEMKANFCVPFSQFLKVLISPRFFFYNYLH